MTSKHTLQAIFFSYNIQRIIITSGLVLIFQIVLYFSNYYLHIVYYGYGFFLLTTLTLGYLLYIAFLYPHLHQKNNRFMYLFFWIFLCLGFIPYIIGDILTTGSSISMVLCYLLLLAVPILTLSELTFFFVGFGVINIILCYLFNGIDSTYLLALFLSSAGCILSYCIHSQYTNLIYRFKYESDTDYLTNILNRKGGIEKIKNNLMTCKRHNIYLGVCMIDIDYFKDYNDLYGHVQGDTALQRVAICFSSLLERQNDVVCRMGGEEFLVSFSCNSIDEISNIAEKLRQGVLDLKIKFDVENQNQYLTISIGTSCYNPIITDIHQDETKIIKEADDALYQAKKMGRNQVCHHINNK